MKSQKLWLAGISIAAIGGFAAIANAQSKATGPIATYVMTAATDSGIAGGGRASMMSAMMGGGDSGASHRLALYLGSTQKPAAKAEAEHIPPAALKADAKLPLLGRMTASGGTDTPEASGKISLFWGCGEKAGAGQPVTIDLGKVSAKEGPALFNALAFKWAVYPSPLNATTYGEWPNQRARKNLTGESSLVGEHVVRGNYIPEIKFTLNQSQDFMAPLNLTRNSRAASGAVQLAWQPVANARGYSGVVIGEARDGTTIIWTSSNVKTFLAASSGFLEAAEINRLLGQKALLAPQQTQCAVPAEVARAVGEEGMLSVTAFGPEANFSYPPKPAGNAPWKVEWTATLLTKSMHSGILGMSMSELMGEEDADEPEDQPKKKKGFGGLLKKVL